MKRALILASAVLGLNASGVAATHDHAWLTAAIDGSHRSTANRARDRYRHPRETLAFFGLRPDMTVVELWPGSGWYTEILGPALRERGKLIAASFGADSQPAYRPRLHRELLAKVERSRELYSTVEVVEFDPKRGLSRLGAPGSADMVLTFRNTHNWVEEGVEEQVYRAAFEVLKPGGIFGVVQHRAAEDADPAAAPKTGYLPERHVIALAQQAGFRLDARSEVNANPRDTKDYPGGVWTLPPNLRLGDEDRERYTAIGESDRMTLRFVKPVGSEPLADGTSAVAE